MRQVTAAVIIEDGRLFLARRSAGDPLAGMWELPGGKVEPGETAPECLERELFEELAMISEVGPELARTIYHYTHGSFEMIALATLRMSDYEPSVHDATCWARKEEFARMDLAPADVELIRELLRTGML